MTEWETLIIQEWPEFEGTVGDKNTVEVNCESCLFNTLLHKELPKSEDSSPH